MGFGLTKDDDLHADGSLQCSSALVVVVVVVVVLVGVAVVVVVVVVVVAVVVVVVVVGPHTLVGGLVFTCVSEPGGEENNIHVTAFGDHVQNTGIRLLLGTTYCARMWSKTHCHKHPCLWRACPNHFSWEPKTP